MTNMLQRMEETGLVTRRRDEEDNRLVRVNLTEAGRERERAITEQFLKLERAVFAGISDSERMAKSVGGTVGKRLTYRRTGQQQATEEIPF